MRKNDGLEPGCAVLMNPPSDGLELWRHRSGQGSPPFAQRAVLRRPCTLMVLARVEDESMLGYDDLLVLTSSGMLGWTYVDPLRPRRLMTAPA